MRAKFDEVALPLRFGPGGGADDQTGLADTESDASAATEIAR